MSTPTLDSIRAQIVELRDTHIAIAQRLLAEAEDMMSGRANGADRDAKRDGEGDTTSVEASAIRNLAQGEQAQADEADAALLRIENGTYGKCVSCSAEIPVERLEVMPFAKKCVNCERSRGLLSRR